MNLLIGTIAVAALVGVWLATQWYAARVERARVARESIDSQAERRQTEVTGPGGHSCPCSKPTVETRLPSVSGAN